MALDFGNDDVGTARPALTVSALNRAVSGLLERSFPLVRVRGEIANLSRASSGHCYFALKDSNAQVRCVMFRARSQLLDWTPRDGDEVEVNAVVSLYEARGEFQLSVEFMRRAGQGRLFEEFLRLKARLAGEGLFASERKRALPRIPRRIAVVTSLQAAALCDLVTTLCRRAPYVGVVIYPVPVQGAGAGGEIAAMLRRVSRRAEQDGVEVVLLVRGGGSIEDLWAFNQEVVARAIVACSIPVIVGIGHESDVTIADFAADLRAPTPTAAGELVAPAAAAPDRTVRAPRRSIAAPARTSSAGGWPAVGLCAAFPCRTAYALQGARRQGQFTAIARGGCHRPLAERAPRADFEAQRPAFQNAPGAHLGAAAGTSRSAGGAYIASLERGLIAIGFADRKIACDRPARGTRARLRDRCRCRWACGRRRCDFARRRRSAGSVRSRSSQGAGPIRAP